MLTVGLGIGLVSLLSDGALLVSAPWLLYAWAISQAVGVDAQLIGAWDRAKRALLARRWWTLLGLVVLGCALAYVGYVAALVFATQEANHVTEAAALASLGMNATTWLWQRVGVSVFLVALSGWTRYRTPRAQTTIEDEAAKLQRELTLEPLRQQLRLTQAGGFRAAASALLGATPRTPALTPEPPDASVAPPEDTEAASRAEDDTTDVSPTDATPAPVERADDNEPPVPPDPTAPVPFTRRARRQAGTALRPTELRALRSRTRQDALEQQAFAALDEQPGLNVEELRKILGCAKRRAGELRTAWRVARTPQRSRTQRA